MRVDDDRPRGGLSAKSRKTDARAQRRGDGPRVDRRRTASRAAAATAWPAWASTCSTATRCSTCSRRRTTTTSATRFSRPRSASRHVQLHLFDGYWEDIGTIRSFYEANLQLAQAESAVRAGVGHGADLHAGPLPAAHAVRRRDDQRQPRRRRLRDRRRHADREQRRSACAARSAAT